MAMKDTNDEKPQDGNDSEDNFGLPDLEYKPLDRSEESPTENKPTEPTTYTSAYKVPEEKSNAPLIIGVIIGLVIVLAASLIYYYVIRPQQAEKARIEQERIKKEQAKKEAEAAEKDRLAEEERIRQEAEAAAAKAKENPPVGAIETLTARTGRYYVVISSAVDGDLSMDYAKKLSAKGVSTKLIPPFGKWKYNRLAVADHPDFASAQADADAKKGEFGADLWVIKY